MDIARLNARSKLSNQQRDFTDNELGRQSHIRNVHLRSLYLACFYSTSLIINNTDKMHYRIYVRYIRRQSCRH